MPTTLPEWIRRKWANGEDFQFTKSLVEDLGLHTVCQSANCPNMAECWQRRTATFMVLGNTCTRSCRYCSVPGGHPDSPEADEPARVAEAIRRMSLSHTVITSVTRDDLPDGGAVHIAQTIAAIHEVNPKTTVEALVPDFQGVERDIHTVIEALPEVFSHNIETVRSIYPVIRSRRFTYDLALAVLRTARNVDNGAIIKSAFMVGHGETPEEVKQTLQDLLDAGCDAVSIGQYLRPTKRQRAVEAFVHPDQLAEYESWAYALGFQFAVAGPFVRSSYRSEAVLAAPFARERLQRLGRIQPWATK